jgi:hypothetical protein
MPGSCDETGVGQDTTAEHAVNPAPGALYRFRVRADNACGSGPLGQDSFFKQREGCPQTHR